MTSPTDKYVVLKGSGGAGLGDRVCGLAAGILYAKQSGRTLLVDWRDRAFGSEQQNLFPELFQVVGIPTIDSPVGSVVTESSSVSPKVWEGRIELPLDQLRALDLAERGVDWEGDAPAWDRFEAIRRYSVDVMELDHPEEIVVLWSGGVMERLVESLIDRKLIDGEMNPNAMFGSVVREHVRFTAEVQQRLNQFVHDVMRTRATLGVHYRKTNEAAAVRSLPTETQYLRATDAALRKLPGEALIFLSTDNRDVQELFVRRYGSDRVRWTEKWLPKTGDSIHKNSSCPDGIASAKDALVDIGILSRCTQLVLTGNSSFSAMADWFSTVPASCRSSVFPVTGSSTRRLFGTLKRRLQAVIKKESKHGV